MTDTPNLGLPLIEASQAQKHVTHNEALTLLDTIVQLSVKSRALTAPPSSPEEGDRYIVKATGTGAFADKNNQIAQSSNGGWVFYPPQTGWVAYVEDEAVLVAWNGSAWASASSSSGDITSLQNLTLLGVGATANSTNPFTAKLNNALWTAKAVGDGGDGNLRYIMSKESAAKTLSILLQDNFSGRAEIGLTGDDDFHFKVSSDGTTWIDALTIDKTSGAVKFNGGIFLTGDISPAQITADQNDYNPTGLSGASVLRLSSDASRNITGLSGGGDGRVVAIVNVASNAVVLKDASTSSSAGNRFAFGADVSLASKQSALLLYDATDSRWKLLATTQTGGGTIAIAQGGTGATTASDARTNLGLGTAAILDVGTAANKVVQLDSSARLPAVDGSLLTNLPGGGGSVPADLDILLAELALGLADTQNVAQFLGSAGNRFAESFDALTYVDTPGATSLDSGTAGLLRPSVSTTTQTINSASGSGDFGSGFTNFDRTALTAGDVIQAIGVYSTSSATFTVKIAKRNSAGNYDIVVSQSLSHPGGGWADCTLTSNYTIPGSGSYYAGAYASGTHDMSGSSVSRAYKAGDSTGTGQSGFTEDTGAVFPVRIRKNPTTDNLTVKSTTLTAASAPSSMKVVARAKFVDSITLNTDYKISVSRDGGTTWTATTLSDRFSANSINVLESSSTSVSSQPSGTSIKWKIETANNKMVETHDLYVYWS